MGAASRDPDALRDGEDGATMGDGEVLPGDWETLGEGVEVGDTSGDVSCGGRLVATGDNRLDEVEGGTGVMSACDGDGESL